MIMITASNGSVLPGSSFTNGQSFNLTPRTSDPGDYTYTWTAVDSVTGRVVSGNGGALSSGGLGVGNWNVDLIIRDRVTGDILSHPSTTISI